MSRLADIIEDVRLDARRRQREEPLANLEARIAERPAPPRGFAMKLRAAAERGYGLIGEIKRASPSKGWIRRDLDPAAAAAAYEAGGAACLSVLTEPAYFRGSPGDLETARAACGLPTLRKDFMIDPWQVAESRAMGADCVLLIMAALGDGQAGELAEAARRWNLDVLAEVHSPDEAGRVAALAPDLVGVNNRDLATFETDLAVTERLRPLVGEEMLVVSESGIAAAADLHRLATCGVRCFLVGESLMRQKDLTAATRALLEG